MKQFVDIVLAGAGGVALGCVYFGALWWTVRRIVAARQPAVLLLASYLVRIAAVVGGVLLIGNGEWPRLVACLVGFLLARLAMCRVFRPAHEAIRREGVSEV